MAKDNEATSPATSGDATGSDGLSLGQAAARLFANTKQPAAQPPEKAAAETTPAPAPAVDAEQSAETTAAEEAHAPSAETEPAETTPAESEAPAETETEPEAETETESAEEEVLSPSHLDEKLKAKIQKRISKEVGKRKALEARIAELEGRLTQQPAPQPEATAQTQAQYTPPPLALPNQPLAHIQDMGALQQHQQLAKEALRYAEDVLDNPRAWKSKSVVDDSTGEETTARVHVMQGKEYSEDEIRAIRREAKVALEDHIPQRVQFLSSRQKAEQVAYETYPFLKDKTSAEYQQAQAMLRDPWVQMRPDALWIVGTQIEGMRALEARKAAATKAKEKAAAPPAPRQKPSSDQAAIPATGAATPRVATDTQKQMALRAEREKAQAKGGLSAAEAQALLVLNSTLRKP